jgi:hypothetical protein
MPAQNLDGVKAIDVAWLAPGRNEIEKGELVLEEAQEICVEVLSPSNREDEMAEKRALYFEAGAQLAIPTANMIAQIPAIAWQTRFELDYGIRRR